MIEGNNNYKPFLELPNLEVVQQDRLIGKGSFGRVDQQQLALKSGDMNIPLKSKAIKSFNLTQGAMFFDHEVTVMKQLKEKGNKSVPFLYETSTDGKVGNITMERIQGISPLSVAPDPEGNVVLDVGLKLAEAIHQTYLDGAVDIDPKIDSYKIEVDSK